MYKPNQFIASQNLLYNFFKWISNVFFLQVLVYFRLIFKSLQHWENKICNGPPCKKLNRKKKSFILKIEFLMLKLDFKMNFWKILTIEKINLDRFNLISKYCQHQNLVPQTLITFWIDMKYSATIPIFYIGNGHCRKKKQAAKVHYNPKMSRFWTSNWVLPNIQNNLDWHEIWPQ